MLKRLNEPTSLDILRFTTILHFQFPSVDVNRLVKECNVSVSYSKKTGRINYVHINGSLSFSFRPTDGRFIPTYQGGLLLLKFGLQDHIVVAVDEAVPFVATGKSLFTKHISSASQGIQPNSEVFVLDQQGDLLAVGVSNHPTHALLSFQKGVGVKVKHYNKQ